jgi:hypothetical protein
MASMHPLVPENLPDQTQTKGKKGEVYAANAAEMKILNEFMAEHAKAAQKEFANAHPELAKKYAYVQSGHAVMKQPGSSIIAPKVMEFLLHRGALTKSKAQLLRDVREALPEAQKKNLHDNIWYRELKPAQWKKMQEKVSGSDHWKVSIAGCQTLDAIRARLQSEAAKSSATFTKTVTISITKDSVTIGDNVYSITANKAKEKKYEYRIIRITAGKSRSSIRVDALLKALQD